MGRIVESFSRGILILLGIGGVLLYMTIGDFIVSLKPARDFEDLLAADKVKSGMHVKGDVLYSYGSFATEETYTQNSNGSRTPAKTSHYYFAIPVKDGEGCIALEVPVDANKDMKSLTDETLNYLLGGEEPKTVVAVDGITKKMKADMKELFCDYLEDELGFTEEQVDAMSMVVIEQPHSMMTIRIMFLIGLVPFALGVFLFIRNYKKNAPVMTD